MSWAAIIAIAVEVYKQRAAAGFPALKLLLQYFGFDILNDAKEDKTLITVGSAPDALKDQLLAWLESQKAKAGIGLKFLYSLMIRFLPTVIDQIWDSLFTAGHVAKPLSDFTPMVMSSVPQSEEELFANLD